jgi:serine/threonine-protein kinase RsbW
MTDGSHTVRLEIPSIVERIDQVQLVADDMSREAGLAGDELHWMGMAVREAVINAIVHGNQNDPAKFVFIDFTIQAAPDAIELSVCIRDQGAGFDPGEVPDPLAPENLLKTSGRGIFMMSQFTDELSLRRAAEGGMEVRLMKRIPR